MIWGGACCSPTSWTLHRSAVSPFVLSDRYLHSGRDAATIELVKLRQRFSSDKGEALAAEAILQQIGPDFGQFLEVYVPTGPLFERRRDAHGFTHEGIHASVGVAQTEPGFRRGSTVALVPKRVGDGEQCGGIGLGRGGF